MFRLLLVDKPVGPTSHDVVEELRRGLRVKKAGHCGTLDPMASGLLLVLTGRATRLAEVFADHDKTYRGTVRFGCATDSDDHTGKIIAQRDDFRLDAGALDEALTALAGRRSQRPPLYSAIKVKGVPLYKIARRGEEPPDLPERPVRIHRLRLLQKREKDLDLELRCSAGTYVRALARDLGEALGIPAHLSALRRLGSGPFNVEDALKPADLLARARQEAEPGLSVAAALGDLPAAEIKETYRERLLHGAQPAAEDLHWPEPLPTPGTWVRLLAPAGELLALARVEANPEPVLRLRRRLAGEA